MMLHLNINDIKIFAQLADMQNQQLHVNMTGYNGGRGTGLPAMGAEGLDCLKWGQGDCTACNVFSKAKHKHKLLFQRTLNTLT
jgi:hypothetical protein